MVRREEAFTLVELLVVMLILGLLTAIAIPSFLAQRDKAADAEAKVFVRTAQTAAEAVAVGNKGEYDGPAGVTVVRLREVEPTLTGAALTVPAVGPSSYTLSVASTTGTTFDVVKQGNGTTELLCAPPGEGACPASGAWSD